MFLLTHFLSNGDTFLKIGKKNLERIVSALFFGSERERKRTIFF
jgi:hypothetical protein